MATDLPDKPESRKEAYLAKAAGVSGVELPEGGPKSREEQYLNAIAEGGGGGGGGTSDFNQLSNRPKYNGATMSGTTNIPEVKTYSAFTGTDGTAAGTSGLVPAPATTDAGKFLKADGTWDTAGGGSSVTVVQTTGSSTTDVMSQDATTKMVYNDPSRKDRVQIGESANSNGSYSIAIGSHSHCGTGDSVAIGAYAETSKNGQIHIGSTSSNHGYNNTHYRLLSGVYDGQEAHDAVTLNQLDGRVKQNAGAPTTSTTGTVGQLLEDTTNGKLYQCTAIDTTDPNNPSYTWAEVGAGGGGPTVVQTTGTSTTDVMSQNATTSMIFADPGTDTKIKIGSGASAGFNNDIAIGYNASCNGVSSTAIGDGSSARVSGLAIGSSAKAGNTSSHPGAVAVGNYARAISRGGVALGSASTTSVQGEVNVGTSNTDYGFNSTNYRIIRGVYDGQEAHDAVTVSQVNATIDAINTALSTSIPHIGASS